MKRTPIRRGKPLQRGTTQLARTTRMARRNARRKGHRFPKLVNEAFREYVRGLPCVLRGHPAGHVCHGLVECCHVKTRGAGGADAANCFPACRAAHFTQHDLGIKSFQRLFGLDLPTIAAETWADYQAGRV